MNKLILLLFFSTFITVGCSTKSKPKTEPQGREKSASTHILETGAKMLQSNAPVAKMDVYMVGFHPMKEHPSHQMEAHHFCKEVNEDFSQCALFDGNSKEANLNGIEYIISEKLFNDLPEKEKQFWHPHNYEILSGQLIAPGLPGTAEKAFLKKKINSYGKTWHVWNTGHYGMDDATDLPTGRPKLAWSFNHDGEVQPGLEKESEKKFNFSLKEKRKEREELIKYAKPQRGVNVLKTEFAGNLTPIEGVLDAKEAKEAQEER